MSAAAPSSTASSLSSPSSSAPSVAQKEEGSISSSSSSSSKRQKLPSPLVLLQHLLPLLVLALLRPTTGQQCQSLPCHEIVREVQNFNTEMREGFRAGNELWDAVAVGDNEAVQKLVKSYFGNKGVLNWVHPGSSQNEERRVPLLPDWLQGPYGTTPLVVAAATGNAVSVLMLSTPTGLTVNLNVNQRRVETIGSDEVDVTLATDILMAKKGQHGFIDYLMQLAVSPFDFLKTSISDSLDNVAFNKSPFPYSPLMAAVRACCVECVWLFAARADINQESRGINALDVAFRNITAMQEACGGQDQKRQEIIAVLMMHGAERSVISVIEKMLSSQRLRVCFFCRFVLDLLFVFLLAYIVNMLFVLIRK